MRRTARVAWCIGGGLLLLAAIAAPRFAVALRWGELTPLVRTFLESAAERDSVGIERLAIGQHPVSWALTTVATQPEIVAAAARSATAIAGGYVGDDLAVVVFEVDAELCPGMTGAPHQLQVQFVRAGERWRISRLGFVPC